jgi:PRTRC genetic system ThiF family protein
MTAPSRISPLPEGAMTKHKLAPALLHGPVKTLVIGCGGTGSAIAGGLPRLHKIMRALGHPGGLEVTFMDGDLVSNTNTVRQAFSAGDVGANKAEVIAHRLNMFYGLDWRAEPAFLPSSAAKARTQLSGFHLIISCVDTRAARAAIDAALGGYSLRYWLDCGNDAFDGQYVLGEPMGGWADSKKFNQSRLPTVGELYPETLRPERTAPGPSCSAAEALRQQGPFVNEMIAHHALQLLARLFTKGEIEYHGQFVNLETGRTVPIPVPEPDALHMAPVPSQRRKAVAT